MVLTRKEVAGKIGEYLHGDITLCELVDWAETALADAEIAANEPSTVGDAVARLGLADVRAFGVTWEDCDRILRDMGYKASVHVSPLP